jgi:hypothetical protein
VTWRGFSLADLGSIDQELSAGGVRIKKTIRLHRISITRGCGKSLISACTAVEHAR